MTEPGKCKYCSATLESTVAHICPVGFWDGRQATSAPIRVPPDYYAWHPSGLQAKDIACEFSYNIGNAIAYEWRAGRKEGVDAIDDLRKAIRHLEFEIERLERSRQRGT